MGAQPPLTKDLEQRVRQLLLLQEVVKKVNSILDLDQLLDEIVGSVAETLAIPGPAQRRPDRCGHLT